MSIKEECELLQSLLSQAISLMAEAKSSADRLQDCGLSEMDGQISSVLDICSEGMTCLKKSQEQIELIQGMFGDGTSLANDMKSDNSLNKIAEKFFQAMQDMVKEGIKFAKEVQTIAVIGSSIMTGIVAKQTAQILEIAVDRIDDISDQIEIKDRMNEPIPSLKKDISASVERVMNDLGSVMEENDKDERKRRKRESQVSYEVRNQPGTSGKK